MNIYLIELTKEGEKKSTVDCYEGFVVVASNPEEARSLCPHGDEGEFFWTNPKMAKAAKIGKTHLKTPRVILASFHAG